MGSTKGQNTLDRLREKLHALYGEDLKYLSGFSNTRANCIFVCTKHGEVTARFSTLFTTKNGCNICHREKYFLKTAIDLHGDKYNYSESKYICSREKVKIYCNAHKQYFMQLPSAHLQGQNCPKCGHDSSSKNMTKDLSCVVPSFREVHGGEYEYDHVDYKQSNILVYITCSIHGDFSMTPSNHLGGQGCSKCLQEKSKLIYADRFIENSKAVHGDYYDYSKVVYTKSSEKVIIICPLHGEFSQKANSHTNGRGCRGCSKGKQQRWTITHINRDPELAKSTPYYIYFVNMRDCGKDVYKIGVTKNKVSRLQNLRKEAGTVTDVSLFNTNLYTAISLEDYIKNLFSSMQYIPEQKFGGYTELFSLEDRHIKFVKEFLEEACTKDDIRV
jgi:hypothetical protein